LNVSDFFERDAVAGKANVRGRNREAVLAEKIRQVAWWLLNLPSESFLPVPSSPTRVTRSMGPHVETAQGKAIVSPSSLYGEKNFMLQSSARIDVLHFSRREL
jgi:hypothetical protein